MGFYCKKPIIVEAMKYTGASSSDSEISDFVGKTLEMREIDGCLFPVIPTLEGEHIASPGDWIIKGVKGEFYPCKPDIFEATYDPVGVSVGSV